MARITIVYWRDIPAQVIAKQGRRTAKLVLPERFQGAIDRAAMRSKAFAGDAYLTEWRRGEPAPCADDLEAEATALHARLDGEYSAERLARLIKAGGREDHSGG